MSLLSGKTTVAKLRQLAVARGANGSRGSGAESLDYQVTVRLNDEDVLRTSPQQYHPNVSSLMGAYQSGVKLPPPSVQISCRGYFLRR